MQGGRRWEAGKSTSLAERRSRRGLRAPSRVRNQTAEKSLAGELMG